MEQFIYHHESGDVHPRLLSKTATRFTVINECESVQFNIKHHLLLEQNTTVHNQWRTVVKITCVYHSYNTDAGISRDVFLEFFLDSDIPV